MWVSWKLKDSLLSVINSDYWRLSATSTVLLGFCGGCLYRVIIYFLATNRFNGAMVIKFILLPLQAALRHGTV